MTDLVDVGARDLFGFDFETIYVKTKRLPEGIYWEITLLSFDI